MGIYRMMFWLRIFDLLIIKKRPPFWWLFFLNIYTMRYLKMFEEFSEIEQVIMAMFEDTDIIPERINIPSNELMYVYDYRTVVETKIDKVRFGSLLKDLGWSLHVDYFSAGREIHEYFLIYNNSVMDRILADDTLDGAVYVIQTEIGIDDGGNAGIFFSDEDDDRWESYDNDEKLDILLEYIVYEINCVRENL